jgi:hypothetical protein
MPPIARFKDLCLDATDHQALADWWCGVMGYRRRWELSSKLLPPPPREDPVLIVDPTGAAPAIWVVPVGERKVVKNRMHLDVYGDAEALVAAGATLLRRREADPEGNEFCCFRPVLV